MHTALMEASMDGHVEVAKLLLDSGAQVLIYFLIYFHETFIITNYLKYNVNFIFVR